LLEPSAYCSCHFDPTEENEKKEEKISKMDVASIHFAKLDFPYRLYSRIEERTLMDQIHNQGRNSRVDASQCEQALPVNLRPGMQEEVDESTCALPSSFIGFFLAVLAFEQIMIRAALR
jgi:hypothetical protein